MAILQHQQVKIKDEAQEDDGMASRETKGCWVFGVRTPRLRCDACNITCGGVLLQALADSVAIGARY